MHSWAKQKAFTIVELLIVIVVIAILAAITIVAYNGVQDRAKASVAQAAAKQALAKVQAYAIENAESYPPDPTTAGLTGGGTDTTYEYRYSNTTTPKTFCLTVTTNNVSYYISNTTSAPVAGACSGHGVNGVAAITNLTVNPGVRESTFSYSNWGGSGGGVNAISRQSAGWSSTGYAARATWSTSNTVLNGDVGYQTGDNTSVPGLEQNTQYTASWRVVTSKSQRLEPAVANWTIQGGGNGTGTGTVNASSGAVTTATGTPVMQWITFTTGPNTVRAKILSNLSSGGSNWLSGDYIEISEFMLVKGPTRMNFADGLSPGWIWNGAPNNSTSTGPPL